MLNIPTSPWPDSTLSLLREGYEFISRRCEHYHSDIFEVRLLMQKTICMRGESAAQIFYNNDYFQRQGALPARVEKTLLGKGGVQGLDGREHQLRKALFMSLMTPKRLMFFRNLTQQYWHESAYQWQREQSVNLLDACHILFCRVACAWAGIPLADVELAKVARDIYLLVDSPLALGPAYWRAKAARGRMEKWLEGYINAVRENTLTVSSSSALYNFAHYRDAEGNLLELNVAAVELLNIIRPIVAISRYVVFAALALHEHPQQRRLLRSGKEKDLTLFIQEVRRFYPFFPAVAAIVKKTFVWQDYTFPQGRRVLLDLYGTNHDDTIWTEPKKFNPERFSHWNGSPFNFVPQGGGSHNLHHRCAGEWITLEAMKVSLRALTETLSYKVPTQDLTIDLTRIPTRPKSGFTITEIKIQVPRGTDAPTRTAKEKALLRQQEVQRA